LRIEIEKMTYKDILSPAIALREDEAAMTAAGEIAAKCGAKAIALMVAVHLGSEYADKVRPLSDVLGDMAAGSRSHAAISRQEIVAWLSRRPLDFDVRDLTIENAVDEDQVVAHARMADLVVLARGQEHATARRALIADILFKSGRPLLLVPPRAQERRWERFVIGWNASANAVRAITGVMPLLNRGSLVTIATVDAIPSAAGHGEAPGCELAAHLARHGVRAEVRNLDGLGRGAERALCEEAVATDADALVIGAYGHSRAQEFIFGGVTRDLLAAAPVPLLLAH
jgi:nucleotide-binding universal stress UspA family protein